MNAVRRPRSPRPLRWPLAVAAALLSVALTACGEEDGGADDPSPAPTSQADDAGDNALPEVVEEDGIVTGLDFADTAEPPAPDGDLTREIVTEGDGPAVEAGQSISVNYLGTLHGGEVFDGNYGAEPISFPIGNGSVIAGWDQALVGVPVGSRVLMSIPGDLAYGSAGQGPIPPDAALYFVVDIVDAA